MTAGPARTIHLVEHRPEHLPRNDLGTEQTEVLQARFSSQVALEYPTPRTADRWRLTAQGWIGQISLPSDLTLWLEPKVPIANLYRMLSVAYELEDVLDANGAVGVRKLPELLDYLAYILARRVLARVRRGLYRSYRREEEPLPYVRGRIDVPSALRSQRSDRIPCDFEEHTADLIENQILAWTLWRIRGTGILSAVSRAVVDRALRELRGAVSLRPQTARACRSRSYIRLNDDYRPMHLLCGFFLDQCSPDRGLGDLPTVPILVDMDRLFETFVARWMERHLPPGLELATQERVQVTGSRDIEFRIDLVLRREGGMGPTMVLDTKYKPDPTPCTSDIAQVVTYAVSQHCRDAVLIYPSERATPLDVRVGDVRVRALAFDLSNDLDAAGARLVSSLT